MQVDKNKSTRWLGLRSYEENDAGVFFGRDKESEQIFRMVNRETLTTIFAPSGTGKTSILRAGVFPKLREDGFLPVWIRLAHDTKLDHEQYIKDLVHKAAEEEGLEVSGIVPARSEGETLWEFLNRVELWDQDNNLIRPVLVLDQFEEMFTLGKGNEATDEFIELLADLIEKRVPLKLRKLLNEEGVQQNVPLDFQGFKIILALREDFVANLDGFRKFMPSIMHNRYRLSSLNGKQALSIVTGPGEGIVDQEVAKKIVRIVAKAENGELSKGNLDKLTIEANLLSLVCHELDNDRLQQGAAQITADGIETTSADILSKFYISSFDGLEPEAMYFVEENLITKKGFRDNAAVDDALENGLSEKALTQLVDQHILRQVERPDTNRIELTHDLLTDVVKESRDKRHLEEEKEEQKRLRKLQSKRLKILTSATAMLVLLVGVLLYAFNKASTAESESEALIQFMTIELYDELLPIGRIDLLDDVVEKAYSHIKEDVGDGIVLSGVDSESAYSLGLTLNKVANVLAKKGNVDEAKDAYAKAIRLFKKSNKNDDEYFIKKAELYQDYIAFLAEWGELSKVDTLLTAAKSSIANIKDEITKSRQNNKLKFVSARVLFASGQYQDAYDQLASLEQKLGELNDPPRSASDKSFIAEVKMQQAKSLAGLGVYSRAFEYARGGLKLFNQLAEEEPANDQYLYKKLWGLKELGEYHFNVGDFDGARDKLELARSIIAKKLNNKSSVEVSSKWYDLAFDLNTTISYTWIHQLEQQADSHHALKSYFEESNRYRKAAELSIPKREKYPKTDESVVVLPKELIAFNRLGVLTNKLLSATVQDPNLKSQLVKLADELDGEMRRYLEKVSYSVDNIKVTTAHTKLFRELAINKHKFLNTHKVQAELFKGIELLEDKVSSSPSNIALRSDLADTYFVLSQLQIDTGQTRQNLESIREALKHQRVVVKSAPEINKRRKLALIIESIADQLMLDMSDTQYIAEAKSLLQEAHDIRVNLKSTFKNQDFVRVSDVVAAGQSIYSLANILSVTGSAQDFDHYLKASKLLNLQEASQAIAKRYRHENVQTSERFAKLAKQQQRKEFLLPTYLVDNLDVGRTTSVNRKTLTPVLIMGGGETESQGSSKYLASEKLRVQHDLGLTFDKSLSKEMNSRIARVSQQSAFELSIAEVAEHTLNYQEDSSKKDTQNLVKLYSPVIKSYPKATPTIIGFEAPLSWSYSGADEKNRNFKLQISTSEDFNQNGFLKEEEVHGNQYLFRLPKSHPHLMNRTFYWRVQYLSDNDESTNIDQWSAVKAFEMYDSHWMRILKTGVIRVAVTQFDGDLLSIAESKDEGSDDIKLGSFDGRVIEKAKEILSQKWQDDRKKYGFADDLKLLKLDPIVFGWEDMFNAVTNHEADIAISTITRTKEREKQYAIRFSEPYHETQLVVAYKKDRKKKKKIDDILKLKLVANKGFRGAEVGELLVGDNVAPQTFANLRLLVNHVLKAKDGFTGGITDATYVDTRLKEEKHLKKSIGVYPLKAKDYDYVITKLSKENSSDKKKLKRLTKLKSMQKDFGTAEWEQYAIATSANDDGKLLRFLNDAILKMRQDNTIGRIAKSEKLAPSKRLLGPNQKLEESLKLTTIVPISPMNDAALNKYADHPVLMGDSISFTLRPLETINTARYKIQVANSPEFSADSLIVDKVTKQPSVAISPQNSKFVNNTKFNGLMYWRAKQLPEGSVEDAFPNYGWSRPIGFEYYKDVIARVKHTGKIHVALNVSNGFSVYKDDQYKHHGFDIDLVRKLAEHISTKLGQKIKVDRTAVEFSEMFKMVQSHQSDLAISGITKTLERENRYDIKFSDPYCKTRQAIIWNKDQTQFETPADFIGAKIISIDNTRGLKVADFFNLRSDSAHKVIKVNNKNYLLEQILNKKADATIMDYPSAIKLVDDFEKRNQQTHFNIAPIYTKYFAKSKDVEKNPKETDLEDLYAIPVHESQKAFLDLVNAGIKDIQQNNMPALKQIFDKHSQYDKARYPEAPFILEW